MAGKTFGGLEVIEKTTCPKDKGKNYNKRVSWWLCKCLYCGKEFPKIGSVIRIKPPNSCGCLRRGYSDPLDLRYLGLGVWTKILNGAKSRDISVSITKEEAWNLYLEQEGKCALSGVSLVMTNGTYMWHSYHTASLDRIDSSKGYEKGNIQWVHKTLNKMKNTFSQDEFTSWCFKVADYHRKVSSSAA